MKLLKKIIKKLNIIYRRKIYRVSKKEKLNLEKYKNEFPKVLTTSETIEYIIKNKASICRFGDAEFDICNQENKLDPYQIPSDKLTKRLTEILAYKSDDKILICIPPFNSKYNNIKNYYGNLSFWEWYWLKKYNNIKNLFKQPLYGNSFVSRDTVFYENKLCDIKKIWENRDVVFVYGEKGRFEHNNIFDNIKSKNIILVPPVNAFNEYDEILKKCTTYNKEKLFLIAAGPTATVLSYDLSRRGYQALDIGHLPNCYDQYLGKLKSPESLPLIKL